MIDYVYYNNYIECVMRDVSSFKLQWQWFESCRTRHKKYEVLFFSADRFKANIEINYAHNDTTHKLRDK